MKPVPLPDRDSAPFWEAAKRRELSLPRCTHCDRFMFPPVPRCPRCAGELAWTVVSGRGRVHTFCIARTPLVRGFETPYVNAVVEIEEQPGCFLNSNIPGCPVESVTIGMPVRVTFEDRDGVVIPQFTPSADTREDS